MSGKTRITVVVTACILVVASWWTSARSVFGIVPPPPVNQSIGIFETRFNQHTEEECRGCHVNSTNNEQPPDGVPVDTTYLPDRHHLLYGSSIQSGSAAPCLPVNSRYADDYHIEPTCSVGDTLACLSCHGVVWDEGSSSYQMEVQRDCIRCHNVTSDHHSNSPHHNTPLALADLDQDGVQDNNTAGEPVTYCSQCHGSLVDDMGDGHTIPTYQPSLVTPQPSGKANGDNETLNSRGTEAGNCNFCHDSGTHDDGREVVYNMLSHHGAGFYKLAPCNWCHVIVFDPDLDRNVVDSTSTQRIRKCENCHGYSSLHNIQVDTDGDDVITPGAELSFYGHIGNDDDCWGCHGFSNQQAFTPGSGPLVPYIHDFSPHSVPAGQETLITVTGVAFANAVNGPSGPVTLFSDVQLTDSAGSICTINPEVISQSSMDVIIPADLSPGNYLLRAVKGSKISNPVALAVTPQVEISGTMCQACLGLLTITGSGFGEAPLEGFQEFLYVEQDGIRLEIDSWSDTMIKAVGASCDYDSVTVNALFGSASKQD